MTRSRLTLLAAMALVCLVVTALPASATPSASATTFVVNSVADRADAVLDGNCQTSVASECTLRAALGEANASTVPVTIAFAIPGSGVQRIQPLTKLPTINNGTAGVTVDGFSQPGSLVNTDPFVDNAQRLIEIVGQGGTAFDGIVIQGSNNVVRGVVLHGFKRAIWINGANAGGNVVEGDLIGLLPDGNFDPGYALVNPSTCIDLDAGAHDNHIGVPGDANRNVVSGCFHKGIDFVGPNTTRNFVQNNIIGMDPTGTLNRGSQSHGVDVNTFTTYTMVGGNGPGERNLISGNRGSGVEISHGNGTNYNSVIGNYIGTDPTGNSAPVATKNNQIGVRLEGKPTCNNTVCGTDEGFETVTDNVIVNARTGGVMIDKGVHDSVIARNRIGITLNGTPSTTGLFGVRLEAGAFNNVIGPGNEIAWNSSGIQITSIGTQPANATPSPTNYNTFTANSIHDNGTALGIDIAPFGKVNQNNIGDANTNERINIPVLTNTVGATNVHTCAGCTVELFGSSKPAGSFGPGVVFIGSAVANASGDVSFATPAGGWPTATLTATTTTLLHSTSEFAKNVNNPLG